jgi:Asp-tRNA(Asn)/Glu-tRNA(Gln) amidotransferase A subunit family amidase
MRWRIDYNAQRPHGSRGKPVRRESRDARSGSLGLSGSQSPRTRGVAAADTLSSRPNRGKQHGLTDLTAVVAVTAMRNGDLKAEDYAGALLDRAQHLESLNAFRTLDSEMVLEAARAADKVRASGDAIGALHGLPIPVKDSVNSMTLPTSNGTRALRNFRPRRDAGVLTSVLAQGAILMGKTNLHELSYGWTSNNGMFGPVHNPYDPARVPGGSSGGSGAAVAARMAPLAVAEDTLGSIRVPATMCGLAGLRPSFGRYPGDGIMPLTDAKFDQAGPLARSVADLALFDAAVTGDHAPLTATPLKGVRIGIAPASQLSGLDPEVERVTIEAFHRLRAAGVTLVEAELPEVAKAAIGTAIAIISYEAMPAIAAFLEAQGAHVTFDQLLQQASEGIRDAFETYSLPPNRPSQDAYESALVQRQQMREEIRRHFEVHRIVALAFPPIMIPPPLIGEEAEVTIRGQPVPLNVAMARNTSLASCASMAGLILPAGMTSNGLPVGLEFDALMGDDRAVLALGLSVEKVLGPIPAPWL